MNRTQMCYRNCKSYRALIFLVLGVLLTVSATVSAEYKQPKIEITPDKALIDRKVAIRLVNFIPDQVVTVNTRLNYQGVQWASHANFHVNNRGMVNINSQPSLAGSYQGVDPMGLFRSLVPSDEKMASTTANIMLFTVTINGQLITAKQYVPTLVVPGTIKKIVRSNGLVATLYYPGNPGSYPGVIMLGGPEGGLNETQAAVLASHGYAVLALAYFGTENLPPQLSKIPLEYLETALNWLQAQSMVDKNRIATLGFSKGAELALLMGAYFPKIRAVIGYGPSAVVWQSLDSSNQTSSWTYHGKPLPYVPYRFSAAASLNNLWSGLTTVPVKTGLTYRASLKNTAAVNNALIPVEKINGPVLLVSGKVDQVWPSSQMAEMIMRRLRKYHHPYPDQHLSYPKAGHITELFYLSSAITKPNQKIDTGGSPLSNSRAGSDSWLKVLKFLDETFKKPEVEK